MAFKKARILVDHHIGTIVLGPNNLVIGSDTVIKALVRGGIADDSSGAVKYCESQGYDAIELHDPVVEKPAPSQADQEKLAAIEAATLKVRGLAEELASAPDDKKADIEGQLKQAEADLDALSK